MLFFKHVEYKLGCFFVVPVGGGLPVMVHFSVTSEPLGAVMSLRGFSNVGASSSSSLMESSDEPPGSERGRLSFLLLPGRANERHNKPERQQASGFQLGVNATSSAADL